MIIPTILRLASSSRSSMIASCLNFLKNASVDLEVQSTYNLGLPCCLQGWNLRRRFAFDGTTSLEPPSFDDIYHMVIWKNLSQNKLFCFVWFFFFVSANVCITVQEASGLGRKLTSQEMGEGEGAEEGRMRGEESRRRRRRIEYDRLWKDI